MHTHPENKLFIMLNVLEKIWDKVCYQSKKQGLIYCGVCAGGCGKCFGGERVPDKATGRGCVV